jgi:hypothetical protein
MCRYEPPFIFMGRREKRVNSGLRVNPMFVLGHRLTVYRKSNDGQLLQALQSFEQLILVVPALIVSSENKQSVTSF